MASRLPTFPRLVFTVVEPITLICGCLPALFMTDWFIREQITKESWSTGAVPPAAAFIPSDHSRLVAQQLGSTYGLLFMVGVAVLYTSTELKVVRNYLVALLLADISHVGLTIIALGPERFTTVTEWNAVTWGNIGITAFLALTRISYLLGWFGPDRPADIPVSGKRK